MFADAYFLCSLMSFTFRYIILVTLVFDMVCIFTDADIYISFDFALHCQILIGLVPLY